jgi:hypothetical protein
MGAKIARFTAAIPTKVSRTPQLLTRNEDGDRLRVTLVRIIEADITNIPELRNIPMISFLEGDVGDHMTRSMK